MGEWAERAAIRFRNQASEERRAEELELQRNSKTQAGAEKVWPKLVRHISGEVKDFNRLMEREFLALSEHGNNIKVNGPDLWLKVSIDVRVPEINFEYRKPLGSEIKDSGEYRFRLSGNDALIIDEFDSPLTVETVGAQLLDPLVT